jgi:hypothetical protein
MLARQSNASGGRLLRPLVLGPTILRRPAASPGHWHADLTADSGLLPHVPQSPTDLRRIVAMHESLGQTCRLVLALATASDAAAPHAVSDSRLDDLPTTPPDIYGWAVLYQLPGQTGTAVVDSHDEYPDLPAFYECPLEFLDRTAFLESKGIPHRGLAVVTNLKDFETAAGRRPRRNRYFPESRFRRPVNIARLA